MTGKYRAWCMGLLLTFLLCAPTAFAAQAEPTEAPAAAQETPVEDSQSASQSGLTSSTLVLVGGAGAGVIAFNKGRRSSSSSMGSRRASDRDGSSSDESRYQQDETD